MENRLTVKDIFSTNIIDLIHFSIFAILVALTWTKIITQETFLTITLFLIASITIRYLATAYMNYVIRIFSTFGDSRSANFLTFDMLKFVLIFVALMSIIVLGLNDILNNETIATLLGGLVGSLLTMRGSYTDLKPLTKKERIDLEKELKQ